MKNCRIMIPFLLSVAFCFALNSSVMAQYTVGVKNGDWIKYNLSMSGQGENVQGWVKIAIENVSGTEIRGTYTVNVTGQQMQQQSFTLDIASGYGEINGFIIPANLTVGQTIPSSQSITVQSITTHQGRTAIYATVTDPYSGQTGQMYWDQATGVLLELTASNGGYEYKLTLVETNMWGGGLFGACFLGLDLWIWIIIIVVIVVGITTVALILHRRKPLPPSIPPPPPPPPPP